MHRELFAALTAAAGLGPDLVHPDLLALGAVAQEFACISADGIVNMSSVGPFIGALRSRYPEQHKRLISLLGCICKVLASPDRVKALLEAGEDGSLGIAMAQVAAHPEPYVRELRAYADLPIPAGVVQCDMRGMIQVGETGCGHGSFCSTSKPSSRDSHASICCSAAQPRLQR